MNTKLQLINIANKCQLFKFKLISIMKFNNNNKVIFYRVGTFLDIDEMHVNYNKLMGKHQKILEWSKIQLIIILNEVIIYCKTYIDICIMLKAPIKYIFCN